MKNTIQSRRFALALAVLMTAAVGCETQKSTTPVTENRNPVIGTQIGNIAPDINGKDLEEKEFKLSDYRGKVVMLDFWAGW